MFEVDKNLKAIILENLPEEGLSISALSRYLRDKGIKIHRLELSGYLKALADMQILRERDVSPSKVFSPSIMRKRNVYEYLGEIVRKEEEDEDLRASIALYVLGKLFRRPIFEKELRTCGLPGMPSCRRAGEKERRDAAGIVSKTELKIPPGDRALISENDYSSIYGKILADLLVEIAGLKSYSSETKQKTLMEG